MDSPLYTLCDANSKPCFQCTDLLERNKIYFLSVMPVPHTAPPKNARGASICRDCAAAESLSMRQTSLNFEQLRQAIASARHENFICSSTLIDTPFENVLIPCEKGDLDYHIHWLENNGITVPEELLIDEDEC